MLPAYRAVFFTGKGQPRKTLATKAAIKRMPDIEAILTAEAARLECRARCGAGRAHGGAAAARPRHRRTLCRAPSAAARALDYDDLIVATRRLLERAEQRRLGALQARRRHRPCAGRRGAGHQPRPVGGDPPRSPRSSSPAKVRSIAAARSSPSATPSNRSSASSAPTRASSPRCAIWFAERSAVARKCGSSRSISPSRSARRRPCSTPSTGCSARKRRPAASAQPGDVLPPAQPQARPAGRGRALAAGRAPRRSRPTPTDRRGARRRAARRRTSGWPG